MEKEVTLSNNKKIKFVLPNISLRQESDLEYSKAFTKALKIGLLPRIATEKFLKETGVWGKEQEDVIYKLNLDIKECISKVRLEEDEVKKSELKSKFIELQNRLIQETVNKQSLFTSTVESHAEASRTIYLFCKCIFSENGSKIWNSVEDFYKEEDSAWVSEALQKFQMFTQGIDESISLNILDKLFSKKSENESGTQAEQVKE